MPPQVPTSFIPKKPLDTGRPVHESGGMGFLFFIALFVFIVSLVAAGGVFAWSNILKASIASKADSLQKAEGAFDIATVQDLIRTDARITNAKTLLRSHVAASSLFAFLSQQTLQSVQFTSFDYKLSTDGTATMVLSGIADSFSSVALQSDQFGASKVLRDVVFSDIKTSTSGAVSFSVSATVDSSLINYGKSLGNESLQAALAPAPQTTISTTSPQATTTRR